MNERQIIDFLRERDAVFLDEITRFDGQVVLSEDLIASSRGRVLPEKYRAVLFKQDGEDLIKVEQPINGGWHPTGGSWHVNTLLKDMRDSISLDWGQQWSIHSGMKYALRKALRIMAKGNKK